MEIPLIAGIIGAAYYFNNQKRDIKNENEPKSIYQSDRVDKIRREEWLKSGEVWKEPNRIFPGPPKIKPDILFNKVDYADQSLPVEYVNYNKNDIYSDINIRNVPDQDNGNLYDTKYPASGGYDGISLTGLPINPADFRHNNMVPFFGGRVKQNMDDKAYSTVMENFTGNINNYQEKKEVGTFFAPQTNVTNPYGMQSTSQFVYDRVIPSKKMDGVAPIERVQVGPGINQGYTAQPSGGFQQANVRDYTLPKTVDELRTVNNPKMSYYGRIISGHKPYQRGLVGDFSRKKIPTYYDNTPDRYFTTKAAYSAPKARSNIVMKNNMRKKTGLKSRIGAAKSLSQQGAIRSDVKESTRNKYRSPDTGHANLAGRWTIDSDTVQGVSQLKSEEIKQQQARQNLSNRDRLSAQDRDIINLPDQQLKREELAQSQSREALHDYGTSRVRLKETERQLAKENEYMGPALESKLNTVHYDDEARETRKRYIENNKHSGNLSSVGGAGFVYDPDDILKTTNKEQYVETDHMGFMQNDGQGTYVYDKDEMTPERNMREDYEDNKHSGFIQKDGQGTYVYDKDDMTPERNMREDYVNNEHSGFIQKDGQGNYVKDYDDKPRTTLKDEFVDNLHDGFVQTGIDKGYVLDPNDKPRKEKREDYEDNDHQGFITGNDKGYVRDPNNKLKETQKEGLIDNEYLGPIQGNKKNGIRNKEPLKTTLKETTLLENVLGGVYKALGMGYTTNKTELKNTVRQFQSKTEYIGGAGAAHKKPAGKDGYLNSTSRSLRDINSKARLPTYSGPKNYNPKMNATTKKLNDIQNKYVNQRGIAPTKVYNSLPEINRDTITKDKTTLPNILMQERMDPYQLKQLDDNPFVLRPLYKK